MAIQVAGASVYVPYYDEPNDQIQFMTVATGYVEDTQSSRNEFPFQVAVLDMLNRANPQWLNIVPAQLTTYVAVSGEGHIDLHGVLAAHVNVTVVGPQVDRWWGTMNVGKYGVCSVGREGDTFMPLQFINCKNSVLFFHNGGQDTFYYAFEVGVVATIKLAQTPAALAPPNSCPPIWYWDNNGYKMADPTGQVFGNKAPAP
jgi:hypothetical protein